MAVEVLEERPSLFPSEPLALVTHVGREIGRASCRERV